MSVKNISSAILGVGVDDTTIDLFESQAACSGGASVRCRLGGFC